MRSPSPCQPGGIGACPPRPDGPAKVRGEALYTDDVAIEGLWHGATVRSPHPHARILRVDAHAAHAADPDVVVLTAQDLPGPNVVAVIADDWPILAERTVRHVGEPVALVAAPSRERAQAAAARVVVEYEPLEAILSIDAALAAEAPPLHEITIEHGDLAAGFAAAAHIVEGRYETGHHEHAYIEPNAMIGIVHPDGSVEARGSLQCPYYVHKALVRLWGLEPERVRVRQLATGGGFGGKEDYPNVLALHATLLSQACGHPVKIVLDRHEDMVATTKRHPSRCTHRTAVDEHGGLLAQEIEVVLDGGAYTTLSPVVLSRAVIHAAGPYRCPNVRIHGKVVATHTPPNGAFRGFGAPQSQFAAERHMDRIARTVGLDPLAIRRHNAYREGDVTPTGQRLTESVSAIACLEEAARRTDFLARWQQYEAQRREREPLYSPVAHRPWRGIGLSLVWHGAGFTGDGERRLAAKASVRLETGGRVEVLAASTDFGQGTSTVLPQIVADAIGIPVDWVYHPPPDTYQVPDSGPTVASRTVMVVGGVLAKAARQLRDRVLAAFAAETGRDVETLQVCAGQILDREGRPCGCFAEAATALIAAEGEVIETAQHETPPEQRFDESTYQGTAYPAYGWLCEVVEIEVEPDTLAVRPLRLTSVCDVGRAIHPVLCKGQIEGGALQAIAWGYLEEIQLADGHYRNDRLQTYIIPTALDTPDMETVLIENPAPNHPTGAKGVGEIPMDGGAPAIVQAIENATGAVLDALPASPERIHDALCREAQHPSTQPHREGVRP